MRPITVSKIFINQYKYLDKTCHEILPPFVAMFDLEAIYGGYSRLFERLRELGSTHEFCLSDPSVVGTKSPAHFVLTRVAFLLKEHVGALTEDRVQLLGKHSGCVKACLTPWLVKADGAGYAEDPSGAETGVAQEGISGIAGVYHT